MSSLMPMGWKVVTGYINMVVVVSPAALTGVTSLVSCISPLIAYRVRDACVDNARNLPVQNGICINYGRCDGRDKYTGHIHTKSTIRMYESCVYAYRHLLNSEQPVSTGSSWNRRLARGR